MVHKGFFLVKKKENLSSSFYRVGVPRLAAAVSEAGGLGKYRCPNTFETPYLMCGDRYPYCVDPTYPRRPSRSYS